MVVIVVIGIISAILIPNLIDTMQDSKEKIVDIYNQPTRIYIYNGEVISEEEAQQYTLKDVEYKDGCVYMYME